MAVVVRSIATVAAMVNFIVTGSGLIVFKVLKYWMFDCSKGRVT